MAAVPSMIDNPARCMHSTREAPSLAVLDQDRPHFSSSPCSNIYAHDAAHVAAAHGAAHVAAHGAAHGATHAAAHAAAHGAAHGAAHDSAHVAAAHAAAHDDETDIPSSTHQKI